jgi:DNA polymerase I-like protein with 3'-5' exonuclease and polymerase domains
MMQICVPGEDMHAYMGARIVGKDYRFLQTAAKIKGSREEQDRYLGKVANLSLQYRTFPKTFRKVARVQYNIPMELPEAQRIHRTYQNTYTQVPRYWERQIEKTKQLGYVETLAGRRVSVVGDWGGKLSWQMESTSLNYPVQGTGADQKYLALQLLKPYLLSIGAYFAWDLHDGIYLWVPDDKVAQVAAEGRAILDNLPYREAWGFTPPIPLPWDCKTGKSWGALKEWSDG